MQEILWINHAVLPDACEDDFAFHSNEQGSFLCVTDGCGGLGSKRYPALENRTGAYLAARLAAHAFEIWAKDGMPVPADDETEEKYCAELSDVCFHMLKGFADEHLAEGKSRIVGSMQRILPTTLCALTVQEKQLCFWWAGDSRGYLLDANGLHQFTKDDIRGQMDAFAALYCDTALSNLLCADQKNPIHCCTTAIGFPSVAIVATDGVYSSLPTPMEMEMLLLNTLKLAGDMGEWQRCLSRCVAANAQDDATLLLLPLGFADFAQIKNTLLPRRVWLQEQFITPVRKHRDDMEYAHQKWLQYKPGYECMEEKCD